MIKRILVGLDPDEDTKIATQYAVEIAKRYQGKITGLAVVDTHYIESETIGGGIGSTHFVKKLQDKHYNEAKSVATRLISDLQNTLNKEGIPNEENISEGASYAQIIEESFRHDMLIVGREPHFFYNKPEKKSSTLKEIIKDCEIPFLIVSQRYKPIKKVLITFDGSEASLHALRAYLMLKPFGTSPETELLFVTSSLEDKRITQLRQLGKLFATHGFNVSVTVLEGGNPDKRILEHIRINAIDLVVAGAHQVSAIHAFAFGSTTKALLENKSDTSLFLYK